MKKDVVIGLVGTAILILAMVGVFRYEAMQGGGSSFEVSWPTSTVAGETREGGTNEGESSSETVDVSTLNLTKVAFALTWTDNMANSGPDVFVLTVTSPTGESKSVEGGSGTLEVVFDNLSRPPPDVRMLGPSEGDVAGRAARDYSSTAGTGAWNVTVELRDAGDLAPVGGVALQQDGANDWTLTPTFTVYSATVERG